MRSGASGPAHFTNLVDRDGVALCAWSLQPLRATVQSLKPAAALPPPQNGRPDRARWSLDRRAFEMLLSLLGPDDERAGREYEHLRRGLILFFNGHGCFDPEEAADETLDRLIRRVGNGEAIADLRRFAWGIARVVVVERYTRYRRRERILRWHFTREREAARSEEPEAALQCISRCAARLSAEDRELILAYYQGGGRDLQRSRKELADRFGLSPNALRVRVHRLRRVLGAAVRHCLRGAGSIANA
jgi:DNA-directed RNA polymerase specialized sigma24 family protein